MFPVIWLLGVERLLSFWGIFPVCVVHEPYTYCWFLFIRV